MPDTLIQRPTAVEGLFYPGRERELRSMLEEFTSGPRVLSDRDRIRGLIVPHAGYVYSGAVAGKAYRELRSRAFTTAVIIAPSHHASFSGVSVYPGDAYETPFGPARIHRTLRERILDAGSGIPLFRSKEGHGREHAIEVQLPFLTHLLPGVSIVPLVMGQQNEDICLGLAAVLASVFDESILLVASTDLSHYHPILRAEALDSQVEASIRELDTFGLLRDLRSGRGEACGGGPTASVLAASVAAGATHARVLERTTSASVSRDTDKVVGYLSAVLYARD